MIQSNGFLVTFPCMSTMCLDLTQLFVSQPPSLSSLPHSWVPWPTFTFKFFPFVFLDLHTWQKTQKSCLCQSNVFLLTKAFSPTYFWMYALTSNWTCSGIHDHLNTSLWYSFLVSPRAFLVKETLFWDWAIVLSMAGVPSPFHSGDGIYGLHARSLREHMTLTELLVTQQRVWWHSLLFLWLTGARKR